MAETLTDENPAQSIQASRHYCQCGAVMIHQEWEGMMGWLCPDPDCGLFEPDPI